MRTHLSIARAHLLLSLTYRSEVWTSMLGQGLVMVTTIFLWRAAFEGISGSVGGVDAATMTTWAVIGSAMALVLNPGVHSRVESQVRQGHIAIDLLRPIGLPGMWLAEDVGRISGHLAVRAIPLVLVAGSLFALPTPASSTAFLLFLPAAVLAFFTVWLLYAIVGMLCFWQPDLSRMDSTVGALLRLTSGSLVPIWFLPEPLASICQALPFVHAYQSPLGIWVGVYAPQQAIWILMQQAAWVVGLALALILIWQRARRRVEIQGG